MSKKIFNKDEVEDEIKLVDADVLIQYFVGDHNYKKNTIRKLEPETFSLITFLENDGARLDKLIHLFSSKLGNHQKYNQTGKLLENQNTVNENLKEQIVDYSLSISSPLNKSLSELFNNQFKKN